MSGLEVTSRDGALVEVDVRRRGRRLAGLGNDLRVVMIYHIRSLFLGRLRFKRREILAIGSGGQPPAMSVWRGAKSGMKMSRREITFEAVSASHGYLMWGAW